MWARQMLPQVKIELSPDLYGFEMECQQPRSRTLTEEMEPRTTRGRGHGIHQLPPKGTHCRVILAIDKKGEKLTTRPSS